MKRNGNKHHREKNHLQNDTYANNILLRIIRDHPESEAIKLLTQELEKVRVEKGALSSYVGELEDKLKLIEEMTPVELSFLKSDKEFTQLQNQVKNLKQDVQKSNTEKNSWRNKYFGLLSKIEFKSE